MNTLNYKALFKYHDHRLATIRKLMAFFITILLLSGLTAIPVEPELSLLTKIVTSETSIYNWLQKVLWAYRQVDAQHPFLLYGYDWLAFAHFVLAILFIGPYRDPIKNIWVIEFGLVACVLILPFAFIAGQFRGVPIGWRLIDCSFGVFGFLPLWICYGKTKKLMTKINS